MSPSTRQRVAGIVLTIIGIVAVFLLAQGWITLPTDPAHLWVAGAAALGFVTGLTTGVSEQPGSGQVFVNFVAAGVLVPLVGGIAALLVNKQVVTEKSNYSGTQLILKTTSTETPTTDGFLHPLAVLGSFFAVFAILAVIGLFAGILVRKGGWEVKARTN